MKCICKGRIENPNCRIHGLVRPLPTPGPKESVIETALTEGIEALGGICENHVSPGKPGVPDRLITLPGLPLELVETKRPKGGKVSSRQFRDHAARAKCGHFVRLIWTLDDVQTYLAIKRHALQAKNV